MRFFAGMLSLLVANSVSAFSYTKVFTEEELQSRLEAVMPIERKKFFLTVIVSEPILDLVENENRLGIEATIEAIVPGGFVGSGRANIVGAIDYNADEGAFYIRDPEIVSLNIKRIPERHLKSVKSFAQTLLTSSLTAYPVFRFKDDNIQHKLAKSKLESVVVEGKKLLVKLRVF
jgi:hypothetical protein